MAVLGGETASLLDGPGELADRNLYSRAFETGGGGGRGYTVIEDRNGGGPEGDASKRHCGVLVDGTAVVDSGTVVRLASSAQCTTMCGAAVSGAHTFSYFPTVSDQP